MNILSPQTTTQSKTHIRNQKNDGVLCQLTTGTIHGSSVSWRHFTIQPDHIRSLNMCEECSDIYFQKD